MTIPEAEYIDRPDVDGHRSLWAAVLTTFVQDLDRNACLADMREALREPDWVETICDLAGVGHNVAQRLRTLVHEAKDRPRAGRVECGTCKGFGVSSPLPSSSPTPCPRCDGTGRLTLEASYASPP